MIDIYSQALNQTIQVDRYIDQIIGDTNGPSFIFFGGIHGNEPAGVFALQNVFETIKREGVKVSGSIYALAGNLWALEKGKRYQKQDLNRLWTEGRVKQIMKNNLAIDDEDTRQQVELLNQLNIILERDKGPFYFVDLHTTSGQTIPFLTVNDSLLNRKFTEQYPCPIILGIEEYLSGPLLSYINKMGFVSFGFEGGQHDDMNSITNHESFVYLSLVFAGVLQKEEVKYEEYYLNLSRACNSSGGVFEIRYRYQIKSDEDFQMKSGYENFQYIKKGEVLAKSNGENVVAEYGSRIFMPLYQSQGDDGFFAIRSIHPFVLKISEICRKWKLDRLLPYLPGVRWSSENQDALIINKKIAKFFAKELMHLMGYRSRFFDKQSLHVKNRESASRHEEYRQESWYSARL